MSKKTISLLLAICMLFCLSACGTTETSSISSNTPFESLTESTQNTDENTYSGVNSQVSSDNEASKENNTTQTPVSQSKPTSTANQPTHTHSYSNATCTSPKRCSCGAIAGIALGHQFSSATCTSPQICVLCGDISGKELGHSYNTANCVLPETCIRCNSTRGSELGHNFKNEVCTRCGKLDRTYLLEDIKSCFQGSDIRYTMESITDNQGTTYSGHYSIYSVQLVNRSSIEFDIGKRFSKFRGIALLSYEDRANYLEAKIYIYGDDKLLFQSTDLARGCEPNNFEIDVTGVSFLKITFENGNSSGSSTIGYITNAYFSR